MTAMYLVQDIETIPETEIQGMWEEENALLKEQGKERDFPPIWAHKIICIGMLVLDEKMMPLKGGCAAGGTQADKSEKEMIEKWSAAASGKLFETKNALRMVDWHGRGFDLPVLQTRAFRYGIQLPWYFGLLPDNKGNKTSWSKQYRDRYQGHHYDLAETWTNRGAFPRPHMANLAKLMGLPGKIGVGGSNVHEAYKAGELADIDLYCMQDVFQTAWIFQRYTYLSGKIGLEEYREVAKALFDHVKSAPGQEEFVEKVDMDALLLV